MFVKSLALGRSLFLLVLLLVFLLFASALAASTPREAAGQAGPGEVTLPLSDYRELMERVAEIERQKSEPDAKIIAEITAQSTRVEIGAGDGSAMPETDRVETARVETTFEIEIDGEPTRPVALPFAALVEEARIEPVGDAMLARRDGDVVFFAPRPGAHRVTLRGHRELTRNGGGQRLALAATPAPVVSLEIELPAALEWECSGTVTVADETLGEATLGDATLGERRRLRLAPAEGAAPVCDFRRRVDTAAADERLARSTVVTVAEIRAGGAGGAGALRRHDVVHFEVLRGELGAFEVDLPAGFELDRAATDEGDALPLIDGDQLTVSRDRRLEARQSGHLALTFLPRPLAGGEVALPPVAPADPPRERYLVSAVSVAAEVEPRPSDAWQRVDVGDLPPALGAEIAALEPNAVWRLAGDPATASLAARLLPSAERIGAVVNQRRTTTLLTVDGTLVHRDLFTVEHAATVFEVRLPAAARLWSVMVDNLAVRPLERGDAILVPLAFKNAGETTVEVVMVEERAIPDGRSRLGFAAARVIAPVLRHDWRLLLPEKNRYRFAASELHFVQAGLLAQEPPRSAPFAEEITITSESPRLDGRSGGAARDQELERQEKKIDAAEADAFQDELRRLQSGRVAGVRPLEVEIPETGKLLQLSGVLPPSAVTVEIEVKER